MSEQLEIVYTMDVLEFAIAVNLMGKKSVMAPGIVREDAEVEEVLRTLQLMVNKQMIMQSGTTFVLCEPYRELFAEIVNATGIVEISVKDHRREPMCCYIGDSLWCVTEDILNLGRIKCRRINDLPAYLEENEYLPVSLDHSRIAVEAEEGMAAANVTAECMPEGETLFEMVYRDEQTGREEWRIGITENSPDTLLWVSEAGGCRVMDYSFGKLELLLEKLQRKEANGIS